ncbi:MAG: hypothetical protein QHI48_00475 [Bacteroidota bacterium]|nr:hypothetical protein [Bacteroidota bacterium]
MKKAPLASYLFILVILCTLFTAGAKMLDQQGMYLAQAYMFTPAAAAFLTRVFFYEPKFRDADLRFRKAREYLAFWLASLGITAFSCILFAVQEQ